MRRRCYGFPARGVAQGWTVGYAPPPFGEEALGDLWQLSKAMYGARRASLLFAEFMVSVFKEAGCESFKVSRQLFYPAASGSLAALRSGDSIAEGDSGDFGVFGEILKKRASIKVERIGPSVGSMGLSALSGTSVRPTGTAISGMRARGTSWRFYIAGTRTGPSRKCTSDSRRRGDGATLHDDEATADCSDGGCVVYISRARLDVEHIARFFGVAGEMSKPSKLGRSNSLALCELYLAGRPFLAVRCDHDVVTTRTPHPSRQQLGGGAGTLLQSRLMRELISGRALPSVLVASDQVRAMSSAEAELTCIVEGAALARRSLCLPPPGVGNVVVCECGETLVRSDYHHATSLSDGCGCDSGEYFLHSEGGIARRTQRNLEPRRSISTRWRSSDSSSCWCDRGARRCWRPWQG